MTNEEHLLALETASRRLQRAFDVIESLDKAVNAAMREAGIEVVDVGAVPALVARAGLEFDPELDGWVIEENGQHVGTTFERAVAHRVTLLIDEAVRSEAKVAKIVRSMVGRRAPRVSDEAEES